MEAAMIAVKQTLVMFLYMLAGWTMFKSGKITEKGSKDMASMLVWLIIPTVIIHSFCIECTSQRLLALGQSALLAVAALGLSILVAKLVYGKKPVDNFGTAFSNAGFMGLPLAKAALGDGAGFYLVAIIALLNILQATYGVSILTYGKKKTSLRSLLTNPILVGSVIGLVLFLTGLGTKLPSVVNTAIGGVAAMNAPVAMLVLGVYLAKSPLKELLTSKGSYLASLWRLLVIPILTVLLFWVLPVPADVRMAVLLAAAAPVGANVAVYAQLNDLDYTYACQMVALSTVLSILSIPLVSLIGNLLFY